MYGQMAQNNTRCSDQLCSSLWTARFQYHIGQTAELPLLYRTNIHSLQLLVLHAVNTCTKETVKMPIRKNKLPQNFVQHGTPTQLVLYRPSIIIIIHLQFQFKQFNEIRRGQSGSVWVGVVYVGSYRQCQHFFWHYLASRAFFFF